MATGKSFMMPKGYSLKLLASYVFDWIMIM